MFDQQFHEERAIAKGVSWSKELTESLVPGNKG